MIIHKDAIAEACRYLDAKSEEFGSLDSVIKQLDVELAGLFYVAQQRGQWVALLRDGQDPTKFSRSEFTTVKLGAQARQELPYYTSTWIDGFAAGVAAEKARNR